MYPARLVTAQIATAIAALVALTMWPPPSGRMLLIPIANGDVNLMARIARAGDALFVGRGPFPGSLVVLGDRARIAAQIRSWNVVIMAAPPAGCGADVVPDGAA